MLPLFMVRFPERFVEEFPVEYENLLENSKGIVTPFDVYKTLKDLLKIQNPGHHQSSTHNSILKSKYDSPELGSSLFQDPTIRNISSQTCKSVKIPLSLCGSTNWVPFYTSTSQTDRTSQTSQKQSSETIKSIKNLFKSEDSLSTSEKSIKNFLKFSSNLKKIANICVEAVNFRAEEQEARNYCQEWKLKGVDFGLFSMIEDEIIVKMSLSFLPIRSKAKFDCALSLNLMSEPIDIGDKTSIKLDLDKAKVIDLIRTSKYGSQPLCLPNNVLGPLREYCCCKDNKQCVE